MSIIKSRNVSCIQSFTLQFLRFFVIVFCDFRGSVPFTSCRVRGFFSYLCCLSFVISFCFGFFYCVMFCLYAVL